MKTKDFYQFWYDVFGENSVTASEICDAVLKNNIKSRLGCHALATQLGKYLDNVSANKNIVTISNLFGAETKQITRVLKGGRQWYRLEPRKGTPTDQQQYLPAPRFDFESGEFTLILNDEKIKFKMDADIDVEDNYSYMELNLDEGARYVFLNPLRSTRYYVSRNMLNVFCTAFGLQASLMSMVARGVRTHHQGWTGYRNDKEPDQPRRPVTGEVTTRNAG